MFCCTLSGVPAPGVIAAVIYLFTIRLIGGDLPRLLSRVGFDVGATGGVFASMDIVLSTENQK